MIRCYLMVIMVVMLMDMMVVFVLDMMVELTEV